MGARSRRSTRTWSSSTRRMRLRAISRLAPRRNAAASPTDRRAVGILSRKKHPHPRWNRGLSRNKAGEAGKTWRGTRHPNWGEVSEISEKLADVGREQLRLFHRGEMATLGHHGPALDVVDALGPMPRRNHQLGGETADPGSAPHSTTRLQHPLI